MRKKFNQKEERLNKTVYGDSLTLSSLPFSEEELHQISKKPNLKKKKKQNHLGKLLNSRNNTLRNNNRGSYNNNEEIKGSGRRMKL